MKIKFFLLLLLITSTVIIQAQKITISNNSNLPFTRSILAIPWQQITAKYPSIDTGNFKVIDAATQKEIPYQLEHLGLPEIQNLLLQITVPAKATLNLKLVKGKASPFVAATYGRYVPERKEDFAWENDKIAFRMYGKELEKTPTEMAYGIDVWVKRVSRLILNERYKRGDYHVDHGDGLDYYHVGLTLGAGNMMPLNNDTICYSGNYTHYKVLDNGPLRTSFQLFYDDWQVGNTKVKAIKTISLDAGSQLNKITVAYDAIGIENLPVVSGIITRQGLGVKYLNEKEGILAYWEPQHGEDGITGVACIFENPIMEMTTSKTQLLAKTTASKTNSITYYAGAVWDKAHEISNADNWIDYLKQFKLLINTPLLVKIIK